MKTETIEISFPFECPFNDGLFCSLGDGVAEPLSCDDPDMVPACCPLLTAEYVIKLVRDRAVK